LLLPEQMVVDPEIVPGVAGILFTLTASVWGKLLPHESFAVTVMLPLFIPAMAVMLFVELDPVHPDGNAQE
jgi:hypothetical protein